MDAVVVVVVLVVELRWTLDKVSDVQSRWLVAARGGPIRRDRRPSVLVPAARQNVMRASSGRCSAQPKPSSPGPRLQLRRTIWINYCLLFAPLWSRCPPLFLTTC